MERPQPNIPLQALKHSQIVNDTLSHRLSALLESLRAHADDPLARSSPAEVAFQAMMEVAPRNNVEDHLPPRPEGVAVSAEGGDAPPPRSTYSNMVTDILNDVVKTIDEKKVGQDERYGAFTDEVGVHLQKVKDAQTQIVIDIEELEKQGTPKIVGDGYQPGFDFSNIIRAPSTRASTRPSTPKPLLELLNPGYETDRTGLTSEAPSVAGDEDSDDEEGPDASPTAREFAQIHPSQYCVSREFIQSHPEILVESDSDGLLIEAFHIALETSNSDSRVWQYVHQALLLQYCRRLGQNGVSMFFDNIAAPGHKPRELFDKEVDEKFDRIKQFVREEEKQRAAEEEYDAANEQIQIQALEPGTTIQIRIPLAEGEDDDGKEARAIFDNFAPDMKKALETGSLDEVNKVLGGMRVSEAEDAIELLGEAGCLGVQDQAIDTPNNESKKPLKDLEELAGPSDVPVKETACH